MSELTVVWGRLERVIAWPISVRAALALTPILALELWTGAIAYLAIALVSITGLIVVERVSRSGVLLAVHATLTAGLFLAFLMVLPHPLLFIALCAVSAYARVVIGRFGGHLITLGS